MGGVGGFMNGRHSAGFGVKKLLSRDWNRRPLDNQSDALTPPPRSALLYVTIFSQDIFFNLRYYQLVIDNLELDPFDFLANRDGLIL